MALNAKKDRKLKEEGKAAVNSGEMVLCMCLRVKGMSPWKGKAEKRLKRTDGSRSPEEEKRSAESLAWGRKTG